MSGRAEADRGRGRGIPEDSAAVLRVLVAGEQPVPVDVLWQIDLLESFDLERTLADLERRGDVHWTDEHLVDASPPARAAVQGTLTGIERARLRGAIGRAARHSAALPPAVVAGLLLDGCVAAPDPLVIPSLLDAAGGEMRTGAVDHAIAILDAVVAAIDRGHPVDPVVRVQAITRLSFLLRFSGRIDDAVRLAVRAAAGARASGDPDALAAAALAWHPESISVSDDPIGVSLIDEVLALPDVTDVDVRARLHAARAEALLFTDLQDAQASARDGLELARRGSDAGSFIAAAYAYRVAHWHPSRQAEMLELGSAMVRSAPRAVDHVEFGAVTRLQVFLETGDWAHLDGELAAMRRRLDQAPRPFELLWYRVTAAARAQTKGEWDAADAMITAALEVASGPDYGPAFQLLLTQQLITAWQQGEDLEPLLSVDVLPAGPMRAGWEAALLGWTCTRRRTGDIAAELDRLLPDGMSSIRPDLTFGPVSASLATAAAVSGATRHADALYEGLWPYREQWAGTGGAVVLGPFALHLARLATTSGRADDAQDLLDLARSSAEAGACAPWLARIDVAAAEAERQRGNIGRAEAHLTRAATRADGLGMRELVDQVQRLRQGTTRPAGLSVREVDVLRLVAKGATNRAIADELFVSIKTVERHLLNAYRKAGVRNRAEATAFALEHLAD